MPNMFENYGVSEFAENKVVYKRFLSMVTREGKAITGYYGTPYFRLTLGDMEFWLSTRNMDDGKVEVTGCSTHCQGPTAWNLISTGVDLTSKYRKISGWDNQEVTELWGEQDPSGRMNVERAMLFYVDEGEGGFLPIHLVSADVLPCYTNGNRIKAQVMALPAVINYYADGEKSGDTLLKDQDGTEWEIAEGSMIPLDYIRDHRTGKDRIDNNYASNTFVVFRARVKALLNGYCRGENGEEFVTFIRCVAETEFGDLEFHHSYEQVPEEMRDNIKVGSIISGVCMLSGDVAILEYNNGIIKDFEHDLDLVRNTLINGEPERMRSILADDAVYETDAADVLFVGKDEIIDRFTYILDRQKKEQTPVFAYRAMVAESEHMEYPDGVRCIAIAYEEDCRFESLMFIDVDDEGLITRIKVSSDPEYHFKVASQDEISLPFESVNPKGTMYEPMILRARRLALINPAISNETIVKEIPDYLLYRERAEKAENLMGERAKARGNARKQINPKQDVENIIGYLYAKAAEQEFFRITSPDSGSQEDPIPFCIEEVLKGGYTTDLQGEAREILLDSRKTGAEYLIDFCEFCGQRGYDDREMLQELWDMMIFVQRLGQLSAWKLFRKIFEAADMNE